MSNLVTYEPEVGAALLKTEPENLYLQVWQVDKFLTESGYPEGFLIGALRSGEITATGTPTPGGYRDVVVSALDLMRLMADNEHLRK